MKIDMEKLNLLERKNIPGTENSSHPEGFFGFFEAREDYNKLVGYGPNQDQFKLTWIHKDYII